MDRATGLRADKIFPMSLPEREMSRSGFRWASWPGSPPAPDFPAVCRKIRRWRSGCETKVALVLAPGAVDVVGGVPGRVALFVEELDEEGRAVDAVGVGLAGGAVPAAEG